MEETLSQSQMKETQVPKTEVESVEDATVTEELKNLKMDNFMRHFLIFGALLNIALILLLQSPLLAGLLLVLGALFIGGLFRLIKLIPAIVCAILMLAAGILLLIFPQTTEYALHIVIAVLFITEGIEQLFVMSATNKSKFFLGSAIFSIIAGIAYGISPFCEDRLFSVLSAFLLFDAGLLSAIVAVILYRHCKLMQPQEK